jgi:hypothetical protein
VSLNALGVKDKTSTKTRNSQIGFTGSKEHSIST